MTARGSTLPPEDDAEVEAEAFLWWVIQQRLLPPCARTHWADASEDERVIARRLAARRRGLA
jgi:hypothetical protein